MFSHVTGELRSSWMELLRKKSIDLSLNNESNDWYDWKNGQNIHAHTHIYTLASDSLRNGQKRRAKSWNGYSIKKPLVDQLIGSSAHMYFDISNWIELKKKN